jgi:eukaryotic-like serine/threonine-protein kinase
MGGALDNAQVAVFDLATGMYKVVLRGGHHARCVPTGHLLYGANGAVRAVAFDLDRLVAIDIGLLSLDGKGQVTPLVRTTFSEGRACLSSDGRWLAYQSNESGQDQIYVQPFPELGSGRWQVSPTGGTEPAWARNGRELFYLDASGALVTVPIQTQPAFSAGNPAKLFEAPYVAVSGTRRYDVTADGQRFLFIKNATEGSDPSAPPSLVVVQNWTEELKRLVPVN